MTMCGSVDVFRNACHPACWPALLAIGRRQIINMISNDDLHQPITAAYEY